MENLENPAVTARDVIRFNRVQLRRAQLNLTNAQRRKDTSAVANIQKKIALYQYTISMAQLYILDSEYIKKAITEAGE